MKFLLSIFLSLTVLLSSFSNVIVYLTFKVNQDKIAKTLCVLRETKYNTCNGRCILEKELKKLAENDKKTETSLKEKQELLYTNLSEEYTLNIISVKEITPVINFHSSAKPNSISFVIFHPPTLA